MAVPPARPLPPHFHLPRWFALVALVSIASISAVAATGLSWFVTERLVLQEARLTSEYVRSLLRMEPSLRAYVAAPAAGADAATEATLRRLAALPDVLRANVYDPLGGIVWSSDAQLIGRHFGPNRDLERALGGEVVAHQKTPMEPAQAKPEHLDLKQAPTLFVEIYVPVMDERNARVIAVLELYKSPLELTAAVRQIRGWIAVGAAASGALLFLALFGLVRRADQTMREQQRRIVEGETLAALGEMSAAVAHGLRNPLASIRSSAELMQADPALAAEASADIVAQSDRLEAWVNELLSYSRPLESAPAPVALPALVAQCLRDFERELARRRIRGRVDLAADLPAVRGDALLLGQVLRTVLANAIEALGQDGQIVVRGVLSHTVHRVERAGQSRFARGPTKASRGEVELSIEDSGPGMAPAVLARVGKPFFTTKTRGLGIGLALARRVLERFGGGLYIHSTPGAGTIVRLHLKTA